MIPTPAADHLRARAGTLRRLARDVRALPLDAAVGRAGPTTWLGPLAQRCELTLGDVRRTLHTHADDLLAQARRFERQADELAVTEAARAASR